MYVGFHQGAVWFVRMSVLRVVWFQVKPSSSILAWVPVGLVWVDQRSIVPASVMVMMVIMVTAVIAFFCSCCFHFVVSCVLCFYVLCFVVVCLFWLVVMCFLGVFCVFDAFLCGFFVLFVVFCGVLFILLLF
jgi:hypothetical protein